MENIVLIKENPEIARLSQQLGFSRTLFLEKDFVLIKAQTKKELLDQIKAARKREKLVFYSPRDEEMLRFALEHTAVNLVFGLEKIHPADSVHFLRAGLDQILCKIAAGKEKTIGFSFHEILTAKDPQKIIARMKFNLKLCKKYKVKTLFSNFSQEQKEMRSAKDLEAVLRVLSKN